MKHLYTAALVAALILVPALARADGYETASCSQDIQANTRAEDQAHAALMADDYGAAYANYQLSVEYRDDCANATSGRAKEWNLFYEAFDYWSLGIAEVGSGPDLWADSAPSHFREAASIVHRLRGMPLDSDLNGLSYHLATAIQQAIDDSAS